MVAARVLLALLPCLPPSGSLPSDLSMPDGSKEFSPLRNVPRRPCASKRLETLWLVLEDHSDGPGLVAVHRLDAKLLPADRPEWGREALQMLRRVVPQPDAFLQLEDSIAAVLGREELIPFSVPFIIIDQQVAHIENAAIFEHPVQLGEQPCLLTRIWDAGEHGQQEHRVKRSVGERNFQS